MSNIPRNWERKRGSSDSPEFTSSWLFTEGRWTIILEVHSRTGYEGAEGEYRYSSTLFFNLGTRWGMGGQRHAPAALPPGKTRYALCRRLDRHQGWYGRVRSPDCPARSDSIYRLIYPGPLDRHTSDQCDSMPVKHDIMGTNITRMGRLPNVCSILDKETPVNLKYKALCRVSWISVRQSEWEWQPITKD
jgi:hypothetical protein